MTFITPITGYMDYITLHPYSGTIIQGAWSWLNSSSQVNGGYFENTGLVINDEYNWLNVRLQKGTFKITLCTVKSANKGISTITFDGNTILTQDLYKATVEWDFVCSNTFVLASNTSGTIEIKSLSKNAASSGYGSPFSFITIQRIS